MDSLDEMQYQLAAKELRTIDQLVADGILGEEECPEKGFLHWSVLKPELLPDWLKLSHDVYGEIRWYR